MIDRELDVVARAMTSPGRGILATDEPLPTLGKRFAALAVECSPANRRAYRELLFTAPGLGEVISAVIMHDETIHQSTPAGVPLVEVLARQGIIPGVTVDLGTTPLAGFSGETVTEGLDFLRSRLAEYRGLGARFAKWRAVVRIGAGLPTRTCLETNAHLLARFAALCGEAGLVPMLEADVLMDGDHPLARCERVTGETLNAVFEQCFAHRVRLESMVLMPNMVVPGASHRGADPYAVAEATIRCMEGHVPAAVPGIAFLSGGQSEAMATRHLDLINKLDRGPWQLTFGFARGLQNSALAAWAGDAANREAAQATLLRRARLVALAREGAYEPTMEATDAVSALTRLPAAHPGG